MTSMANDIFLKPRGRVADFRQPAPCGPANNMAAYLDSLASLAFSWSLVALGTSCFKAQPQPQLLFFSAIVFTSFLLILRHPWSNKKGEALIT
jgi:hypothetical protein